MLKVLLLDRDGEFRARVAREWDLADSSLREAGFDPPPFGLLESGPVDLVFLDAGALWQDGVDLVSWIRTRHPHCQVSLLCDESCRAEARTALSRGGHEVLVKPLDTQDLQESARGASSKAVSRATERTLQSQVLEDMLGDTPGMRKILRIAHAFRSVLLFRERQHGIARIRDLPIRSEHGRFINRGRFLQLRLRQLDIGA